jgi:hypothetical protein
MIFWNVFLFSREAICGLIATPVSRAEWLHGARQSKKSAFADISADSRAIFNQKALASH